MVWDAKSNRIWLLDSLIFDGRVDTMDDVEEIMTRVKQKSKLYLLVL